MKFHQEPAQENKQPLLGAKVVFSKHVEQNKYYLKNNPGKFTLGKVYTVVSYWGELPEINCGLDGNTFAPMKHMLYDIIEEPEQTKPSFQPVTLTLETTGEVSLFASFLGAMRPEKEQTIAKETIADTYPIFCKLATLVQDKQTDLVIELK